MFVIHIFFFSAMYQVRIYFLCLFKKSDVLYFFPASWLVLSNWSINSPGEAILDIVLEVSENSQGNVYSEVPSKVATYQHGVC